MSIALATYGFGGDGGLGGEGGGASPVLENITPITFSVDFEIATLTPIEFDLTDLPLGAFISIQVKMQARDETLIALDFDGLWCWPFDVQPQNSLDLSSDPAHVTLLPRGGWPPGTVDFKVAASYKAVPA